MGAREAALAQVLAKGSIEDSLAALDEYAWRSLLAGLRVREYCAAASHAVRNVSLLATHCRPRDFMSHSEVRWGL